jgi:hypothetical protein
MMDPTPPTGGPHREETEMSPSKGTTWAPEDATAFLRWVPAEQHRQSSDPDGASLHYLVHVDDDLIDLFLAEVGDPGTGRPADGFYLVHVGGAGQVDAEFFGEDEDAATRATWPWVADYLEGDDGHDGDLPTMHVESVHKPAQAAARASAVVVTEDEHTYDEILDHGLAALGETRRGLFGYGVEGHRGFDKPGRTLHPGTYTVYADRD